MTVDLGRRRPVWLIGVDQTIDRRRGADLQDIDLTPWGVRALPMDPPTQWSPAFTAVVRRAVDRGIDVRWLVWSGRRGETLVHAYSAALDGELPSLAVMTEKLLPEGYQPPRGGITAQPSATWQADAVRLLVPIRVPLLWTPDMEYFRQLDNGCGSPGRRRKPADVAAARTGSTTMIEPRWASGKLHYLTDRDLKRIGTWIDEQRTPAGEGFRR
ncbi:Uncharacterised protein [Mycobacteroides abscessus subsp. abscessus]|uniref:hypothetical protein n=1 Tax=Mycobacteroides abscessus TaxID=36809 RepID=UPI000929B17E|nr:hypothetical protein [Mycobacteroides abscessus]SHU66951.1 Uncharacterised protein [Mycobacteroides abscessus subsp. abscessus]